MKSVAAFSLILIFLIPVALHSQDDEKYLSFQVQGSDGEGIALKELLDVQDFSNSGVLILSNEIDEKVLHLAKLFDVIVKKNKDGEKKTVGAIIYLSKDQDAKVIEAAKENLQRAVQDLKIATASEVPEIDKISKEDAVNLVMWNKTKIKARPLTADQLKNEEDVTDLLVEFLGLLDEE